MSKERLNIRFLRNVRSLIFWNFITRRRLLLTDIGVSVPSTSRQFRPEEEAVVDDDQMVQPFDSWKTVRMEPDFETQV